MTAIVFVIMVRVVTVSVIVVGAVTGPMIVMRVRKIMMTMGRPIMIVMNVILGPLLSVPIRATSPYAAY